VPVSGNPRYEGEDGERGKRMTGMVKARLSQIGGDHYVSKAIQPWDAMKAWMSKEQFEGYLRGCIIKYICRYPEKGGIEDLKKARHYLEKLIEEIKT
jgi:hypothetical protein